MANTEQPEPRDHCSYEFCKEERGLNDVIRSTGIKEIICDKHKAKVWGQNDVDRIERRPDK